MLYHTTHATFRMEQRGINDYMLSFLLKHGKKRKLNKAEFITIGRKQTHLLKADKALLEQELTDLMSLLKVLKMQKNNINTLGFDLYASHILTR